MSPQGGGGNLLLVQEHYATNYCYTKIKIRCFFRKQRQDLKRTALAACLRCVHQGCLSALPNYLIIIAAAVVTRPMMPECVRAPCRRRDAAQNLNLDHQDESGFCHARHDEHRARKQQGDGAEHLHAHIMARMEVEQRASDW
jgi:hypothetical protein